MKNENENINMSPKKWKELRETIEVLIKERGKNADLNDIDVTRRGWIIGGISFVGAAAIVTAILVK